MRYRLLLILFVLGMMICPIISATITIDPPSQKILLNGTAFFTMTVTNNAIEPIHYKISSPNVLTALWDVHAQPRSDAQFILQSDEIKEVQLFVKPISFDLPYTKHLLTVDIDMQGEEYKESLSRDIIIDITNPNREKVTYPPHVEFDGKPLVSPILVPGEEYVFTLYLQNKNSLNISHLKIVASTSLFSVEQTISIKGYERISVPFTIPIDIMEEPKIDELIIVIEAEGKQLTTYAQEVEISETKEPVIIEEQKSRSWLKSTENITFINPTNVNRTKEFSLEKRRFDRFFLTTYPEAEEKGQWYTWSFLLEPGAQASVSITRNYNAILFVIIVLILLVAIFQWCKPGLSIKKEFNGPRSQTHGSVLIHIKNKSPEDLEQIKVKEVIPNVLLFIPSNAVGGVSPSKVLYRKDGATVIFWEIPSFARHDEQMINYKVEPRLEIDGFVKWDATVVSYGIKGKKRYVFSNNLKVMFKSKE